MCSILNSFTKSRARNKRRAPLRLLYARLLVGIILADGVWTRKCPAPPEPARPKPEPSGRTNKIIPAANHIASKFLKESSPRFVCRRSCLAFCALSILESRVAQTFLSVPGQTRMSVPPGFSMLTKHQNVSLITDHGPSVTSESAVLV
jgi:hypothetical protein